MGDLIPPPCTTQSQTITTDETKMSEHNNKRAYIQVDYQKRRELLEQIDKDHSTIKAASEKLNINYSTAKNIIKLFRKEKRIHKLPKRVGIGLRSVTDSSKKRANFPHFPKDLLFLYSPDDAAKLLGRFNSKTTNLNLDQAQTKSNENPNVQPNAISSDHQSNKSNALDSTYSSDIKVSFDFMPYHDLIKEQ